MYSTQSDYQAHLLKLQGIKGQLDQRQPKKFTHLKPKTFNQDLARAKDIENQNLKLIRKIVSIKTGPANFSTGRPEAKATLMTRSISTPKKKLSSSRMSNRSLSGRRNSRNSSGVKSRSNSVHSIKKSLLNTYGDNVQAINLNPHKQSKLVNVSNI